MNADIRLFLSMFEQCLFTRVFKWLVVNPTYCFLHLVHVIEYIMLDVVHVAEKHTGYFYLVTVLVKEGLQLR